MTTVIVSLHNASIAILLLGLLVKRAPLRDFRVLLSPLDRVLQKSSSNFWDFKEVGSMDKFRFFLTFNTYTLSPKFQESNWVRSCIRRVLIEWGVIYSVHFFFKISGVTTSANKLNISTHCTHTRHCFAMKQSSI